MGPESDAVTLVDALRSRALTARALMERTLEAIGRENPRVNAIVSLRDADALLAEADAADAGPVSGPLHGLPMAVKDLVATQGLRTTWGSPIFADHIPDADERVARRLKRAGAIVIGKTNVPEFGLGSHSTNPVHGVTRCPFDASRTAGGSSGGAAAALATGMVALADGSDMMGSLRNPAAFCGVYGMRPTWGLCPPDAQGDTFLHPLSTDGPMARTPRDLALLLGVLAGPDPARPERVDLPRLDFDPDALKGARIGWLADWAGQLPMEDGVLTQCETALRQLEVAGATVVPCAPPMEAAPIWDSWITLRSWAVAMKLGALYRDDSTRALIKPALVWEIERGLTFSAQQVHDASTIRSTLYARLSEMFETYDALVLPSAQVWPFPVDWDWPKTIAGHEMDTYHRWMEVVIAPSLCGLPAIALPAGLSSSGLPMGIQMFGPKLSDGRLLAMADAFHRTGLGT